MTTHLIWCIALIMVFVGGDIAQADKQELLTIKAANKLADAARIIHDHPMALQLRYLQTMREVAAENNSTTIFPLPIDLFRPFLGRDNG